MILQETALSGAFVIKPEKKLDDRGFFARSWCQKEFHNYGLCDVFAQSNISFNKSKGTVRGMHYQDHPHWEVKLVRCTKGVIYDVIVDLRIESKTYGNWVGIELSEYNHNSFYIPEGFAHGYQTLTDNAEIIYFVSKFYVPEAERGIRWDDPFINIKWPLDITCVSDRDSQWPDYMPVIKEKCSQITK